MKKSGFTLIELLIVVAIIAILAAIAVPNFLEAQVRSKVARVKADMRSLATAVESYQVDHNKPPYGYIQSGFDQYPFGWGNQKGNVECRWSFWTSPIAYMTSIPDDPFVSQGRLNGAIAQQFDKHYLYSSTSKYLINGTSKNDAYFAPVLNRNISWMMHSFGPSRRNAPAGKSSSIIMGIGRQATTATNMGYPDLFYDPSNGTTSFGWIVRSGAGFEPAG